MQWIGWLMVVAALLPVVSAGLAKAGGKRYDNNAPRAWLASQEGWRARAHASQQNGFEALPFFYAAVLYALYTRAEPQHLAVLMGAWLLVRVVYIALYVGGYGTLRSVSWLTALILDVVILFSGV